MKGKFRLRRLPSPAMVVAVIALVTALTGAAVALPGRNSVTSNDIKPKNVKKSDIRPAAVDAYKTDVMKSSVLSQTVSTSSDAPVDLGGPNVTVKVPKGGLVQIFAEANLAVAGGGQNSQARIHLYDPASVPNQPQIIGGNSWFPDRPLHGARYRQPDRRQRPAARRLAGVLARRGEAHVLASLQRRRRWNGPVARGEALRGRRQLAPGTVSCSSAQA